MYLRYLKYIFTVIEYTFRHCTIRIHIMHYCMPVNFFTEPGHSDCECSQDIVMRVAAMLSCDLCSDPDNDRQSGASCGRACW